MKTRILNAKIACLDIDLRKARMQLGVQIIAEDPEELERIRNRYRLSDRPRGLKLINLNHSPQGIGHDSGTCAKDPRCRR